MIQADGTAHPIISVLLGASILAAIWFGWVRRLRRPLAYLVLGAIAALLAAYRYVAPEIPSGAVALAMIVVVVLLLIGVVLVSAAGAMRVIAVRTMRRSLRDPHRRPPTTGARGQEPASAELETLAAPLEAAGFERLFVERIDDVGVRIALLRADGAIAEVMSKVDAAPEPTVAVEITSMLLSGRGLLCSGTSGIRLSGWAGELRQVFPGIRPAELVVYHDDAVGFLIGSGITTDPCQRDQVDEAVRLGGALVSAGLAAAPGRVLLEQACLVNAGVHQFVGELASDPEIERRVEAFWASISGTRGSR